MNQAESVLLDSIKKALFGVEVDYTSDIDWQAVLQEAKMQAVVGIVAQGVPDRVRTQWKTEIATVTASYIRILHVQKEIVDLLDQASIPVAILKGTAAAIYYPKPAMRAFGDVDCIVPQDQFEKAQQVLREHCYIEETRLEDPRHIAYQKNDIEVELHRYFSDTDLNIEEYIINGLHRLERKNINGNPVPMLPTLANGLVLLTHIRHHLRSSIGLRQVIDWMMYVNKELDDAFWKNEFEKEVTKMGLTTLAKTVTKMCQKYLGLNPAIIWCSDADDSICDELLNNLLSSGNFGSKQGLDGHAENVATEMHRIGVFRKLQKSGQVNWKAYKKHPWLEPFCWLYQVFRYIRQLVLNRKEIHLREDKVRAENRIALLRNLGIY